MTDGNVDEKAILDAAAEIFAQKGFAGARVDEIAALAGVNKAMLYYRIGDKEELYRRVVLRGQKGFRDAIENSVKGCSNAREAMEAMVKAVVDNALEDRLVPSIILRELAGRGTTLPEEGLQGIGEFMQTVRSTVEKGVAEGSFRPVDPVVLQFMVIGSVFTLALTAGLRERVSPGKPGPLTHREISSGIMEILSRGILSEGGIQE